jgi:hypothetical protein
MRGPKMTIAPKRKYCIWYDFAKKKVSYWSILLPSVVILVYCHISKVDYSTKVA